MGAIKNIFLQHLRQQLRNKYSIFWNLVFPLVLLTILGLVFGGQSEQDINFEISIATPAVELEDLNQTISYAGILNNVFTSIENSEDSKWFLFYRPAEGQNSDEFLRAEKDKLETGERDLILVLPEARLPETGQIEIHRKPDSQMSRIAADIIRSIISEINREINISQGNVDQAELISTSSRQIQVAMAEETDFSVVKFLVPGIILFTFLNSGLEILVSKISSMRSRGILRRYFATPLKPIQYFAGILGFIIVLSIAQVLVIYGWSRLFFGIDLAIFSLDFILYLIFALIVSVSLGFLVLSIVKSKESTGVVTNALIYPMAFLGGIFFEVSGISGPLGLFVSINPMTYLVNGMRDTLGIYPSPTSQALNLLIPAAWMLVAVTISIIKFNWNPGGDS
ncbi:MAG: ABC transporter permease [Bacillota bacterium]